MVTTHVKYPLSKLDGLTPKTLAIWETVYNPMFELVDVALPPMLNALLPYAILIVFELLLITNILELLSLLAFKEQKIKIVKILTY